MSSRNKTIKYENLEQIDLYNEIKKDFYSINLSLNKIIHWDAIGLIKKIPSNSIDLILTDPPYNLDKNYAGTKFSSTDNNNYEIWLDLRISECQRILKNEWSIYICCDRKSSIPVYNIMNKYFIMKNRITREREKWRWASNNWKNNIEDIYFAVKNDKKYKFNLNDVKIKKRVIAPYKNENWEAKDRFTENWENYRMTCPSNIWTDITIPFWSMSENTEHPTQKPEKVIAKLILASSNKWDIVFDPFLWSWTTAVVSKKLWRNFIAFEKENDYCVISQHRLNLADNNINIQWIENWIFLDRNASITKTKDKWFQAINSLFNK